MRTPVEPGPGGDTPGAAGKGARIWKVANGVMLVAFALGVVVQINDPDPLAWLVIYASAASACLFALLGRSSRLFPLAVAIVAVVWAASLAPAVLGRVPFPDMFGAWEMEDLGVEVSREMYGLLLIAGWMCVLAVRTRRR